MQYPIVYLVLKRLRAPLILLIIAYTVATAGMVLIPGIDVAGNPVHFSIFQSFYFISYVATTIGFGEIPYEFTDVQRLWVIFCIYLTVISWLVAIGNIISLLQDPALRGVWKKQRFIKQVGRINKKFCIIGGYGETGELLLEHLSEKGYQCVVIDNNPERINLLDLNSSVYNVPYIQGDVSDVETLKMAGLGNDYCRAVLAVTSNERINVKVSAVAKLLHSHVKVICRVQSKEATANAKSFDTDYIINPNYIYAESISRAFRLPSIQQLIISLLRRSGKPFSGQVNLPKGHWIICGYDAFGREMVKFLEFEGMDYTVISDERDLSFPHIKGIGTEAVTLRAAGIDKSVGIVAGTSDDTDNFSIIMTARHLKPNLYLAARQNQDSNRLIFRNAEIDSVMESARLMVWHMLPLLTQPRLSHFLHLAKHQDEPWGKTLMKKLTSLSENIPETYIIRVDERRASAVIQYLNSGNILRLQELYVNDTAQADVPVAIPLMLIRDGKEMLLPEMTMALKQGDLFLMASKEKVRDQVLYTIQHEQDFYYVIHGEEKPVSIVMDHIKKRIKYYKAHFRQKRKVKGTTVPK
ncbi:MAG: potassium channel family protein [Ostreibacterium sp.]